MADFEVKEYPDPARFAHMLRAAADAIEQGGEAALVLQGETYVVHPQGRLEVEYEVDGAERALEFKAKWEEAA